MRSVRHDADSPRSPRGEPRVPNRLRNHRDLVHPELDARLQAMTTRDERPTLLARSNRNRCLQTDPGNRFLEPLDALAVECAQAVPNNDVGPTAGTIMRTTSRCFCCFLQHIISYRHVVAPRQSRTADGLTPARTAAAPTVPPRVSRCFRSENDPRSGTTAGDRLSASRDATQIVAKIS